MKNKLAKAVMTTLLGTTALTAMAHDPSAPAKMEKCYGIAKAKKNDCGTSKHACAALAPKDGMADEWIFVMKGNCQRIVGGSLTPPADDSKKS